MISQNGHVLLLARAQKRGHVQMRKELNVCGEGLTPTAACAYDRLGGSHHDNLHHHHTYLRFACFLLCRYVLADALPAFPAPSSTGWDMPMQSMC